MVQQGTRQTVAEFEAFLALPENRDRNFELIDGEIVEKMPTQTHGRIAAVLTGEIYAYLKQHPIGYVEGEVRYQIPEDIHNSVQPDVSFFKDMATPSVDRGPVFRMPDLAVEIKSPDDTFRQMRKKAEYYITNGSQIVWLVFPDKHEVEIYTPDADVVFLSEQDTLDGGEVLPGFSLKVADIFSAP